MVQESDKIFNAKITGRSKRPSSDSAVIINRPRREGTFFFVR